MKKTHRIDVYLIKPHKLVSSGRTVFTKEQAEEVTKSINADPIGKTFNHIAVETIEPSPAVGMEALSALELYLDNPDNH